MELLVKRGDFAARAGVSAAAITRVCKTVLAPACVGNRIDMAHPAAVAYLARELPRQRGKVNPPPSTAEVLDLVPPVAPPAGAAPARDMLPGVEVPPEVPAALKRNPRVRPARDPGERPHVRGKVAARETKKAAAAGTEPANHETSDMQRYGDMTLRDLVAQFGTDTRFLDWLRAYQTLEGIQEKRIKNATATGDLVSRELIRRGVLEPVNETATKLLTDAARTISVRASAMAAAGQTVAEVEALVVEIIQSYIRPLKARMARSIAPES